MDTGPGGLDFGGFGPRVTAETDPASPGTLAAQTVRSAPKLDRAAARELVQSISTRHGYIRQEVLDRMSEADRREVQHAMLMKDQLIASSVTTLARNLYTSSARFVFELLQNADDNIYEEARASGEVPEVSFSVYHDQIVIECNEDGFTSENLEAICNVGKSSKTEAQGYTGEKGIGFKSVFMAAYRAFIQSGHFSFSFQHRVGDPGMGMITPVWENDGEYLGDKVTRITLFLHDQVTQEELAKQRQTIHQQFKDIHHTILLFMKKIKKITIALYDNEKGQVEEPHCTVTYTVERRTDHRQVVKKCTTEFGQTSQDARHYHMTEHVATGLAKNENRTYSPEEDSCQSYSQGDVVLAFPLTAESVPIVENQWIFALLPVRQMGFKFLIHADFVTQANRQDIVTSSARNEGLAGGIAEAFIKAVLQMCDDDTLQYVWMRYLPSEDSYPWDGFWKSVINKIKTQLKATPVLRPAKPGPLRLIGSLKRHSAISLDQSGEPLFPDKIPDEYIDLRYGWADLDRLTDHGLVFMSMGAIIARVEADLAASSSRMRSTNDLDWHSRAAKLLNFPFTNPGPMWRDRQQDVKRLNLLPLRDGRWTSTTSGIVCYPNIEGTDLIVPLDLDFKVVDPAAVTNIDRKQLFHSLGVKAASVPDIRNAIRQRYQGDNGPITLANSVYHLRFLYLTRHLVKRPFNYLGLKLYSQTGKLEKLENDFFFHDNEPYGAADLLLPTARGPHPGDGAPGLDVLFLNNAYFQDVPSPPTGKHRSWKMWLHCSFDICLSLPLLDDDGLHASDICKYVAFYRPEKFLGFLQAQWRLRDRDEEEEEALVKEVSEFNVLCQGQSIVMRPLRTTYLPIRELQELRDRFMLDSEFFPWLKLESPLSQDTFPSKWETIGKAFGLGFRQQTLDFILDILGFILDANPSAEVLDLPERICELYNYLQAKMRESSNSQDCQTKIRNAFISRPSIFVPETDTREAVWALPEECVWAAPVEMTTKHSLAQLYADSFAQFSGDNSDLANFFLHSLKVPNCGWNDIIAEIRALKSHDNVDFDRVSRLYKSLDNMDLIGVDASELKRIFETEPLIYSYNNRNATWHKTSQCLWSSATQIMGMPALRELYGDLETFFLDRLGVQKVTAKLVYDKLKAPDCPNLSVTEIKETIMQFNAFLGKYEGGFDPFPVVNNEILPVRFPSGEVRLRNAAQGFALLDRQRLGDDFASQAKFLDFSMDEIRTLRPFISWTGLEERYLSRAVKEISSANDDSTQPISSPGRDIKQKAHALLRIAVTYNSPRIRGGYENLYTLLRNAKTLGTDKIMAELLLSQDGEQLRVEKEAATLHIHEGPSELTVYVPSNERVQEICFTSKLPRCLYEWLMTEPTTRISEPLSSEAINVVQSVLNVKPFALSEVLDEHGINSIDIPDPHAEEFEQSHENGGSSAPRTLEKTNLEIDQPRTPRRQRSDSSGSDGFNTVTPPSSVCSSHVDRATRDQEASYLTARSNYAGLRPQMRHMNTFAADESDYTRLLHIAVTAARRAVFPSRGPFDMSGIQADLLHGTSEANAAVEPYRLRSTTQIERDKQVGAAGELFVFEVLSRLNPELPGFSRVNWQSTIREYVTSHPDYSNLTPWNGRETADITYDDVDGVLTNLLIDKGYLAPNIWAGAKLKYFIEVKTTTGPCSTPFFMSKHQYERMQNQSNDNNVESRQTEALYVIFRVFNLGTDSNGFKVLVDPESMRQRGELVFRSETWSVVAGG